MKKTILLGFLTLSLLHLVAQERFGKAIFTVPAGWQMTKTSETVTLQSPLKKGGSCKIIISSSEAGAVNTVEEYLQYRKAKGGTGITYTLSRASVVKYEANGLTTFFSKGTVTRSMIPVYSYFYTLSNGDLTFYYQLLTSSNDCINVFNGFIANLKMEMGDNSPSAKKRAAAAAPAAPAPMM